MGNEIDFNPRITLEDLSTNPWSIPATGVLTIAGKTIGVTADPDWTLESKSPDMRLVAILVDQNILFTKVEGILNATSMQQSFNLFHRIIEESGQEKVYLIPDLREMSQFSLLFRTVMDQNEERLRKFWNHIAIIPSPVGKTIISLYRLFRPNQLRILTKVNSVREAFLHILELKSGSNPDDPESEKETSEQRPDFSDLGREELIQALNDQVEENRNLKQNFQNKIDYLFENIGRITWDRNFQPLGLQTDESDPFFDLFNAVTILQQDVSEMIEELKILNESLEEKIAKGSQEIVVKESNLRAILENNDASIWLLDDQYRVIDFNDTFAKAFEIAYGVTLEPGMIMLDSLPDQTLIKIWKGRYDSALAGAKGIYTDTYNFGGQDHIYEITTYPILDQGHITGISIFSREITKQKKAEEKLLRRNKQLKKLNQELDRFVYSTSHDLRAPLVSINGLIQVALKDKKAEHLSDYLNRMRNSVKKLEHFIQDITNYSRNARLTISKERIDFTKMVDDIFEELKYIDVAQKVKRNVDVVGVPCYSDPNRLFVILSNLISNSLRYADPEKDVVEILISIKVDATKIRLTLRDNGIGIDATQMNHIFEMFYRGTDKSVGSGLGLYIVKETITKLKGSITAKSKPKEGSIFTIKIPNLPPSKTEPTPKAITSG